MFIFTPMILRNFETDKYIFNSHNFSGHFTFSLSKRQTALPFKHYFVKNQCKTKKPVRNQP